jgi:uncharacterized protein (TIGR02246 family)
LRPETRSDSTDLVLSFALAIALSAACAASAQAPRDLEAEEKSATAAISAASRSFSDAFVKNDTRAIADCYTADAVLLPPGREIRGREAAAQYFAWGPNHHQIAHEMKSHKLRIRGSVAIDEGTWTSTSRKGDGEPTTSSGKYLVVWVLEDDGKWRIEVDMWHRPDPPSKP